MRAIFVIPPRLEQQRRYVLSEPRKKLASAAQGHWIAFATGYSDAGKAKNTVSLTQQTENKKPHKEKQKEEMGKLTAG